MYSTPSWLRYARLLMVLPITSHHSWASTMRVLLLAIISAEWFSSRVSKGGTRLRNLIRLLMLSCYPRHPPDPPVAS